MKNRKRASKPAKEYKILCVDKDETRRREYKENLSAIYNITTVKTLEEGIEHLDDNSADSIFEDEGVDAIAQIKSADPTVDVIPVFDKKDPSVILEAAQAGASGYLARPYELEELLAVIEIIRRNKKVHDRYDALIDNVNREGTEFIGQSETFIEIIKKAAKLKGHWANVLITGESGTGKEMLARFIHSLENDPKRLFVAINCAAIPDTLIEAELFGYEKGAFTGATQRKLGKFELANGGDIFLDEISTLKPELQAKILRVIEEKTICRLGDRAPIKLNFRVIAATNENIEELLKEGAFRLDLYHRLKVIEFRMPSLRERVDDIPLLVGHFLKKHNKPGHEKIIKEEALELLKSYNWPGNIRELENLIHNLIIMAPNGSIELQDVPPHIIVSGDLWMCAYKDGGNGKNCKQLKDYLEEVKMAYIKDALAITNGNKSKAAELLGISRSTIHQFLEEIQERNKN